MRKMCNTLKEAKQWHALGVSTIPIRAKSKRPALQWQEYQERLPSDFELRAWFANSGYGLAVVTGWRNLMVVDFDSLISYSYFLSHLGGEPLRLINILSTYRVNTAKGAHLYFWSDEPPRNGVRIQDGVDVRGIGGYVLAPPTIHPSGVEYTAIGTPSNIKRVPSLRYLFPDMPEPQEYEPPKRKPVHDEFDEVMSACGNGTDKTRYALAALDNEAAIVARAANGCRNHTLNKAAFNLGGLVAAGLLSDAEVRSRLEDAASACGLRRFEIGRTIDGGLRAGIGRPRDIQ